jgi:L-rhamnose isomerase
VSTGDRRRLQGFQAAPDLVVAKDGSANFTTVEPAARRGRIPRCCVLDAAAMLATRSEARRMLRERSAGRG